jgi:HEAT repeat protein
MLALDDDDEEVRISALTGLWEESGGQLLDQLVRLVANDPSGVVRAAAATGLGRYVYLGEIEDLPPDRANQVRDALCAVATHPEQPFEVRRRAIESLGYRGAEPEIERLIAAAYADPEQFMKESALVAMGRSMQERWLGAISAELGSISPALRHEAARAVGEMADSATALLPRLLPLVDDEDTEVCLAAIWALGQVGGPHARRVLQRVSRSKDDTRRQAAAEALDELSLGDSDIQMM